MVSPRPQAVSPPARTLLDAFDADTTSVIRSSKQQAWYFPPTIATLETVHLRELAHRGVNVQLSQPTIDKARRAMGPPETAHWPMAISAHPYSGNHCTVLSSIRSLNALSRADCQSPSSRTFSQPGSPCESSSEGLAEEGTFLSYLLSSQGLACALIMYIQHAQAILSWE